MNEEWVTGVTSLLVSLIALGGVIYTNHRTGRNLIAAEDRRAQAAIDAENRRHDNELRRATRERVLDVVRDIYFELEGARRALYEASYTVAELNGGELEAWRAESAEDREAYADAVMKFGAVRDKANLFASQKVGRLTDSVWRSALLADMDGDALAAGEPMATFGTGGLERFKELHEEVRKGAIQLLDEMRNELHPGRDVASNPPGLVPQ